VETPAGRPGSTSQDLDAVVAGLSLPFSNGPIEGTNTKFKL